jgi:hypothetical protein
MDASNHTVCDFRYDFGNAKEVRQVVNSQGGVNAMQRRLTIASTIALISLLILPIAFATTTPQDIIVKQDVGEDGVVVAYGHDAWQLFKIPQRCRIDVVELFIQKSGNCSGFTLGFYYWNVSGNTLGTKIYEQNFTSVPSSYAKTNFTLTNPVTLSSSAYTYALYFKPFGGSGWNDQIGLKVCNTNPYPNGDLWVDGSSGGDADVYFILYGELLIDPTAIVYQWLPTIFAIMMMGVAFGMLTKLMKQR